MKRFLFIPLLILLLPSSPLLAQILSDRPSDIKEYTFDMRQFSTLCVQDNVNVVYNCSNDSVAKVTYKSLPEFENAFFFTNERGTLKVQVNSEDMDKPGLPTLYISSAHLVKIENYSDGIVNIESVANCDSFTASLVGNGLISVNNIIARSVKGAITTGMGKIILSGRCDDAMLKMTGAGTIKADRLKSINTTCKIFGGGQIYSFTTGHLTTKGIGSTKIYYRGHPEISKKGGGKLIQMD